MIRPQLSPQSGRLWATTIFVLVCQLSPVQAEEYTRFVLTQPLSHIREVCAHVSVPDWGCVFLIPATDNPGDIICVMHVPHTDYPWEEEALLVPLRALCMAGQGR